MNTETNEMIIEPDKPVRKYKPRKEPENLCPWCKMRYERRKNAQVKRAYTADIEYKEIIITWK